LPKITVPDLNLYVRPLEDSDVKSIVPNLRDSDVLELAAVMGPGKSTEQAVQESVDKSKETYSCPALAKPEMVTDVRF
jgi:hypothetical protein